MNDFQCSARRSVGGHANWLTKWINFFNSAPEAQWDFAAGPELNNAVVELLSPGVRQRLQRSVAKSLVNQRVNEVRAHFAGL